MGNDFNWSINTIIGLLGRVQLIAELNKELEGIIENSYDGIYVTDGNACTVLVNQAYSRLTGLKKEELLGRNMKELVERGIISRSATLEVLKTGQQATLEQVFETNKKALVSSNPVFDEKGNIIYVVTNVRDVTELYELKNQLASKDELNQKYHQELEAIKSQVIKSADIIAQDKKMLEILYLSKRLAKVDTTILLLGETGVGKEEMAKFIHKNSDRSKEHFIKINCGAIPENLIESELFGYERGAFTGAQKEGKLGLFQVADGGTVFLDEIGELPLDMQVKMLRFLQEGEIIKVGGVKSIRVNVRVLAATNRDLKEMVKKNIFREDLYYRINVVPITIPPLRERRADIPLLSKHFLDILNKKYNMNKTISELAMGELVEYSWPGNVRELKNIVERGVVMTNGDTIFKSDLELKEVFGEHVIGMDLCNPMNLKELLEKTELDYMYHYYKKYKKVRKAADALGMEPSSFVRKRDKYIEKYGDWARFDKDN